jgi:PAS domain S-box-containing protein
LQLHALRRELFVLRRTPVDMNPANEPAPASDAWLADVLSRSREYAVVQLSLDGTIVGWRGAAQRLFGYRLEEVSGRSFAVLFTEQDRARGIPQIELDMARKAARSEDDRWHVRKDGSRFWANGVVTRQHAADKSLQGFVKVLRDRTDLRIRYVTLHNRVDALQQEVARRDEALRTLLHEMRNPLSPLLHATRLLEQALPEATRPNAVKVIARQVDLLRRLVDEAGVHTSAGQPTIKFTTLVLQDALRTVVDGFAPAAAAAGVQLQLVMLPEPVHIDADADRLHQMVLNLVANAMKYTPSGGHITVSSSVEGDLAVIRVDDDGIGIEKDNLERVFDLFVRERTGDEIPGFGVGLAVVKRLATLHGGFVEARSPGRGLGSQFTLQLPLKRPAV